MILKNTYWNKDKRRDYGIDYSDIEKWHVGNEQDNKQDINSKYHLIDINYGEQMYVNDKPIAFHQGRFVRNLPGKGDEWITKSTKYLEEN